MNVVCVGMDPSRLDHARTAIGLRWPDASVTVAAEPENAVTLLQTEAVDLAVILASDMDGPPARCCSEIRLVSEVPLLVFGSTDSGDPDEEVSVLDSGADEYVCLGAGLGEIVARIIALLRRIQVSKHSEGWGILQVGDLRVDPKTYQVMLGHSRIELTAIEFNLLVLLMRNRGIVVRHAIVERAIWGGEGEVDNSKWVKKYIHRLRRKLAVAGDEDCIRNVYGVGYMFVGGNREPQVQETA